MLNTFIYINFIANIFIILFLLYKFLLYRITFEWERTFWAKYKTGIRIWWWSSSRVTARGLYIPIASKNKLEKKDNDYFKKHKDK
jgi:hypothetical protein